MVGVKSNHHVSSTMVVKRCPIATEVVTRSYCCSRRRRMAGNMSQAVCILACVLTASIRSTYALWFPPAPSYRSRAPASLLTHADAPSPIVAVRSALAADYYTVRLSVSVPWSTWFGYKFRTLVLSVDYVQMYTPFNSLRLTLFRWISKVLWFYAPPGSPSMDLGRLGFGNGFFL